MGKYSAWNLDSNNISDLFLFNSNTFTPSFTTYDAINTSDNNEWKTKLQQLQKRQLYNVNIDKDDKLGKFLDLYTKKKQNTSSSSSTSTSTDNGDEISLTVPGWELYLGLKDETTGELKGVELSEILLETGLDLYVHITAHESTTGHMPGSYHDPKTAKSLGLLAAYDIVPKGNTTFQLLHDKLFKNNTFIKWMIDNQMNLLDEVHARSQKWTGKHFHIGHDPNVRHKPTDLPFSVRWDKLKESLKS